MHGSKDLLYEVKLYRFCTIESKRVDRVARGSLRVVENGHAPILETDGIHLTVLRSTVREENPSDVYSTGTVCTRTNGTVLL
jgi:hypothetical protein